MCCEQKHDIMTDEEELRERRKKPYRNFLKRILKEQYEESEEQNEFPDSRSS